MPCCAAGGFSNRQSRYHGGAFRQAPQLEPPLLQRGGGGRSKRRCATRAAASMLRSDALRCGRQLEAGLYKCPLLLRFSPLGAGARARMPSGIACQPLQAAVVCNFIFCLAVLFLFQCQFQPMATSASFGAFHAYTSRSAPGGSFASAPAGGCRGTAVRRVQGLRPGSRAAPLHPSPWPRCQLRQLLARGALDMVPKGLLVPKVLWYLRDSWYLRYSGI